MRTAAIAILLLPAAAADIGKRYPSERRAIADHRTGAMLTAITTSPAGDDKIYQTHPQWTAGGRHIIFRSDRAGGRSQAFAYSEETGEIIQLTDAPDTRTGTLNVSRRSDLLWFFRGRRLIELRLDPLLADSRSGS
ncbi:MAG: oligogalacturonate lyase family protein, partial [Bryobacteraceae bacterium]